MLYILLIPNRLFPRILHICKISIFEGPQPAFSVWIGLAFRQIEEENEGQINPTKLQIGKHNFFLFFRLIWMFEPVCMYFD